MPLNFFDNPAIPKWIFSVFFGSLIVWASVSLVKLLLNALRAFPIAIKLLSQNRPKRNDGSHRMMADRMLDIAKKSQESQKGRLYRKGSQNSVHHQDYIDEELRKLNIVTIYDARGTTMVAKRDTQLAGLVILYLRIFLWIGLI